MNASASFTIDGQLKFLWLPLRAEEFVSAINQVNIHEEAMLYEAAALVLVIGYSVRNAFMGEMDAARRAGITAAKNAETASANAAMPRAAGSQLETP
jgi:hypothetical protein